MCFVRQSSWTSVSEAACHQQVHLVTRRSSSSSSSEYSSKVIRISRFSIVPRGARVFCLGIMLALIIILTLPCKYGVGAVTFSYNGFKEDDVYFVSDSSWTFNPNTSCFYFNPPEIGWYNSVAGRFLHKGLVQMVDPVSGTAKSFSTTFIYQIQVQPLDSGVTGPGMAFIIVPDNVTVGANNDYMGLITADTSDTSKNYESDNHTFGVELDTHLNPEFGDPNENHIGINLASMNSTYTVEPSYKLASPSTDIYQQIWIDYFQADSRIDIYYAIYGQGKPATPQGSQSRLDLSLLEENMYIGFSAAMGGESVNVHYVYAWSFTNDGVLAPSIVIGPDVPPAPPPAPNGILPPAPPAPVILPPAPPNGPVAAPPPEVPSSPPEVPPSPSPVPTLTPPPSRSSPPTVTTIPPPFGPPSDPPSPFIAPPGPDIISGPTTLPRKGENRIPLGKLVGVPISLLIAALCISSLCWRKVLSRPLRIFISHTGGENGAGKNFPTWLHERMTSGWRWSRFKFRVRVFFDVVNCPMGLHFRRPIFRELARFDVGVVVVTEDFFGKKWPMTELIAFVEAQMNDPEERVRILPLFYELTPDQVRNHLELKTWEENWEEFSRGDHPLEVAKCGQAVNWLCSARGIRYVSERRDHDKVYIETILKEVDIILCKERSFASDFRWAMTVCIPSHCTAH